MRSPLSTEPGQGLVFRLLKMVLVATILVFAIAAFYMSFLIFQRQQSSLSNVSHFDVTWSASQGVNEFERLYQRVTALELDPSQERRDEVRLRFDILKGRLNIFSTGDFQAFISGADERRPIVERFSSVVGQIETLLGRLEDPDTARQIQALMAPIEGDLVGLAAEAAYFSSVTITDFEQELLQLHRRFSITALGFFICGIAFVALLGWHNRLLGLTHERLRATNSDLQSATSSLAHMARHDLVTGLPNRLLFREYLEDATSDTGPTCACLICLDLDNFKNVNDTLGHQVGDALLRNVAMRLSSLVGSNGIVARFGGDEFVIALNDIGLAEVADLAYSMVESVGHLYDIDGHQVSIGASVGIGMAAEAAGDPELLLRNADIALYRAKRDGRGTYRFFEPEMDARLQRMRALDLALRSADFDNDFQLLFQPIIDLQAKRLASVEVLLRWPDTPHGAISPDEFIPIAEDNGVIVPLGAWALRKACAVAASLPDKISLAINISAVQFYRSDVVETITSALAETGLSAHRLELEITETLFLEDSKKVHSTLSQLRAMGIRISLDDFGTGFSSLAYLRKFAVDKVKIDRSFILGIDQNTDHLAIVQAIVSLTHALGMTSVAEGVETDEQLLLVRASGCNQAQGHLFSHPLQEDDIKSVIASYGPNLTIDTAYSSLTTLPRGAQG